MNIYKIISCVILAVAVILGAFGAHAWSNALIGHESTFETASQYHFIHGLGLLLFAMAEHRANSVRLKWAALLMTMGIVLFSGSLYLLSFPELTGDSLRTVLGPITPIGGVLLITSWLLAAVHFLQKN